ncbi:hypothetical protein A6F68_01640 [Tsuneonella dongtanensis]|uniref:Uncharacterized protein n=1 Tax=Tsuneonella dongtanensis TaxID=692370 RepID=A0A1B2ADC5_9SPHN|nr:hypothetical protein [Tsuneonella dongtanensis]ANY20153.1 hypothetical protein A6F68_01640 [Tsuneonella dongtanensis]
MTVAKPAIALIPAALLAACATPGNYPSLAQRPAERVEGTFQPDDAVSEVPAPVQPSADLAARLADLVAQAEAGHREFQASTPAAERLAGNSGGTASDSWAAAQVALADLDSIRSRVAVALAELDSLWVDATVEAGPREAIGSARATVEALVVQEDTVLARLRGRI